MNFPDARQGGGQATLARGCALFFAGLTALGLSGGGAAGLNLWWVDARLLPAALASAGLAGAAALLGAFAWRPCMGARRGRLTRWAVGGLLGLTALNALGFWGLLARGDIRTPNWIPASLLWHGMLWLVWRQLRPPAGTNRAPGRPAGVAATALACALLFPLVQAVCFGLTSYRRPADVAVVFGARVYADGRLSDAVADRVRTAVALYHSGAVRRLVMSGGPGDGAVHETEAMTRQAVAWGVPAAAITQDRAGLNTAATVRNTAAGFRGAAGLRPRVLAVSEYYHLPRIKQCYRAAGVEVFTVPARPRQRARYLALRSVLREIPGFWWYAVRRPG
jgi:uncharacterized SAM-binding protein YcdF (DUF218 family)